MRLHLGGQFGEHYRTHGQSNAVLRTAGLGDAVLRGACALVLALFCMVLVPVGAQALEAIVLDQSQDRIDLSFRSELIEGRGDRLQVDTAPGSDGVTGRMAVRAATEGTNPNWIVFALRNPTENQIERWLVANRYSIIGSGILFPDLDERRLERITPSVGFVPEAVDNDRFDIFRITIDPGASVTYIVELSSVSFPRMQLWKPVLFEKRQRDRTLFNGIMLGVTGLLGIFLTSIFAANHRLIFPVAGLVAWSVLAYLCIDFGFWHKLFKLSASDNAFYRAASEAAVAASIVFFLFTFLRLNHWHGWVRALFAIWIAAQIGIVIGAVLDPRLASTLARASFGLIGSLGTVFVFFLALRGQDRALALVPTWLLFLVWIFGAGITVLGKLSGDIVVSGLVAGLVLVVLLIGFTVTQFAFRSGEPILSAMPGQLQSRALAIEGAGAAVWEWNARRDEIALSPQVEDVLGLNPGELSCRVEDWAKHIHPSDRERFRLMLWSIQEKNGGAIQLSFRMRRVDSSYRWFELQAASIPDAEQRTLKCVGLMRDITDVKRSHERLMHDAVHDSLTGLPNRELFLDRLDVAIRRTDIASVARPTVLFIDIDRFKNVNSSFGLIVGDSMLLTLARRLGRHLGSGDTLGRIGGDQFAIMLTGNHEVRDVAMVAERTRRALRSPMTIAGKEIILTGSIGIARYDGEQKKPQDLLREAELAMYRAKRSGSDRIEIFKPAMRGETDERLSLESDLRKAIERGQIRILYQPIVALDTEELAGFEALIRWDHPKLGMLAPGRFIPIAEESDLIVPLGSFVLNRATKEVARWQAAFPRPENPLFISVNISSRQLFRQDLVQEVRMILGREDVPRGTIKLEVTETLVMENPERAAETLGLLKAAGAGLALDDFGTGYSSLSYLHRFPFDTIKVDKTLIQHAGADETATAIVRSTVALVHELGKSVVAEGVETPEEASFLRSISCEYAQGFLYGQPKTEREVMVMLDHLRKLDTKSEKRTSFVDRIAGFAKRRKDDLPSETDQDGAAAPADSGTAVNGAHASRIDADDRRSNGGEVPNRARPVPTRPDPARSGPAGQPRAGNGPMVNGTAEGRMAPASRGVSRSDAPNSGQQPVRPAERGRPEHGNGDANGSAGSSVAGRRGSAPAQPGGTQRADGGHRERGFVQSSDPYSDPSNDASPAEPVRGEKSALGKRASEMLAPLAGFRRAIKRKPEPSDS